MPKNRSDGEFVALIKETFDKAVAAVPSIVFLDDMDKFAEDNLRQNSNKEEFSTIQSCLEDIKDSAVFVVAMDVTRILKKQRAICVSISKRAE